MSWNFFGGNEYNNTIWVLLLAYIVTLVFVAIQLECSRAFKLRLNSIATSLDGK